MRAFGRKRRAEADVASVIVGLVVIVMVIVLGAIVVGQFQKTYVENINATLPADAQQAVSGTFTTIWDVWDLLGVLLFVVVIGAIIGYLLVFRGGGGGS